MTWEEIKQRKEESIRESTNNPMINDSSSYEKNGKTYKSFSDYLKSDEYKEFLEFEVQAIENYKKRAKEYFESLEINIQFLLFFHITNTIYENYFNDKGSYRGLLYDKFGFGPESYGLGLDSGMFSVHNAISTPEENEAKFQALVKYLKLDLPKEKMKSLRNIFEYGFDNSEQMNSLITGQKKFDFTKDPE